MKLPPASATQDGIVSTGTQSFAGNKTFTGVTQLTGVGFYPVVSSNNITGAGSFNVDLTPNTNASTDYLCGILLITGNAFNGGNPIRAVYSLGGRKDLATSIVQVSATLPGTITISSVSIVSSHTIRITISSTAASAEVKAVFIGGVI
jgi:hypothetical protein